MTSARTEELQGWRKRSPHNWISENVASPLAKSKLLETIVYAMLTVIGLRILKIAKNLCNPERHESYRTLSRKMQIEKMSLICKKYVNYSLILR
jgi:hypothetical protein